MDKMRAVDREKDVGRCMCMTWMPVGPCARDRSGERTGGEDDDDSTRGGCQRREWPGPERQTDAEERRQQQGEHGERRAQEARAEEGVVDSSRPS